MLNNVTLSFEKPLPSYAQLEQALRSAIVARRLAPGSQLPEERELARQFSVSRGTLRRALGQLEEAGLLVRRQGHGTFVAEPEKLPAVPIAVMIEGDPMRAAKGFPGEVFQALTQAASQHGVELLLRSSLSQRTALEPGAFIFIFPTDKEPLRQLVAQGRAVVSVDYVIDEPGVDSIVFDNVTIAREITRHLLSLGHRRIGYLEPRVEMDTHFVTETNSPLRLQGMREALREAPGAEEWIRALTLDEREIARDLPALLQTDPRPTAFLAFDETSANGIWLAAQKMGLRVPEDLSIACLRLLDRPPRAGVDWSGYGVTLADLGRMAVERALERIQTREKHGLHIFTQHSWCPGATCAPVNGK